MIYPMTLTQLNPEFCVECSESELIEAARHGNLDAFNTLVTMYQDVLFRVAFRIFADEDSASDAVQDALIAAFQHMHSFRDGSFKGWLIRIVVNKCNDHLRSARCRKAISLDTPRSPYAENDLDPYIEVRDPGLPVERRVEVGELDNAIQSSLNELPLRFRAVVILADIEGLDYEEVSDALNIPVGTVKSRLARARIKLRGLLLRYQELLPGKYTYQRK